MRTKLKTHRIEVHQERAADYVALVGGYGLRVSWCRSMPAHEFGKQSPQIGPWKWTARLCNLEHVTFTGYQYVGDTRDLAAVLDHIGEYLDVMGDVSGR